MRLTIARAATTFAILTALTLAACSPSRAPEAARLSDDPAAVHARMLVLDTHLDTPVHFDRAGWSIAERHTFASDLSHVDLPRMREGGLDGGFFVVYTPQGALTAAGYAAMLAHARRRLAAIHRVVQGNRAAMQIALTAGDAARIAATGRRAVFISVENMGVIGDDLSLADEFYRGGVRMAGPVHSRTNQLADSATGERRWSGLSPLGRRWVAAMNRLGIVIDGSHSSDETVRQMIRLSRTPIILSHSGFKAIFDHRRNVDDRLAREIAASGGVIQVNSVFLSRFNNSAARAPLYDQLDAIDTLSSAAQARLAADWATLDRSERVNEGDFDLYMRAMMHCLQLVGWEHCGMGADWDGGGGVAGMEDITALPHVTARLLAAGYSEARVQRVMGYNALRLLRAAEIEAGHR